MRLLAVGLAALLVGLGLAESAHARTVNGCTVKHHAKCAGLDLSGRNLRGVVLRHADLRGANLENADLRGADLRHANLRGARLRGAKLHHRRVDGASERNPRGTPACYPDCQGADLSHADLTNAQLAGANLSYANLSFANLTGAELRSANLAFADLTSASLASADFTGAMNCASATPTGILAGEGCADDTAPVCYETAIWSATTETFTVNGSTFSMTSATTIPDDHTQITSLTVEAWVVATGFMITTSSRTFTVAFSGSTGTTYSQSLSGSSAPFSTSSGTARQSKAWDVQDTGYGVTGSGRIKVMGGGSLGTWSESNPDQRIRVMVSISGNTRTAVPCA